MTLWRLIALFGFIAWFLPVFRFRRNKYFLFYYINSLYDPLNIIFSRLFHIHILRYVPGYLFLESITIPSNDLKSKIISTIILFVVILKIGNDTFLEFVGLEIVEFIIIVNLLYEMYIEIKEESAISIFKIFLLLYFFKSAAQVYLYYDALGYFLRYFTILQFISLLVPLFITYFGSDKKLKVCWFNKRSRNKSPNTYELSQLDFVIAGTEINIKDLTWTELRVLYHLSNGKDNNEICRDMSIGKRTVYFHIQNIKSKLNLTSTNELRKIAVENRENLQKLREPDEDYSAN